MLQTENGTIVALVLVAGLLGSCAQSGPVAAPAQPKPDPSAAATAAAVPEPPSVARRVDPMADVPGDKPLPPLKGAAERMDCANGIDDLHRIGFEARGGQVTYFTYYNKWRLRMCSLELTRDAPGSKWRLAPDGATRVHSPEGVIIIRTRADAYEFEFQNVARRNICGTPGQISGTIIANRGAGKRECSVRGFDGKGG